MMTIPHLAQHMNGFLPFPCFAACRDDGIVGDDIQWDGDLLHLAMWMLGPDGAPQRWMLIQMEKPVKVLNWIPRDDSFG